MNIYWTLVGILIGITNAVGRLRICAITTAIKKYKSMIKKKEKEAW